MKKYEDILNETKKYNFTWEVDFDNGYKKTACFIIDFYFLCFYL